MKKIFDRVENVMTSIMIICFVIFTALTLTQVVSRYVFNSAITWTEQVSRYLFIWLIFQGMPILYRHYSHASFTMLQDAFSERPKEIIKLCINILILCFAVFFAVWSTRFCIKMANKVMVVINLPMNYVYAIQPVSAVFLGLFDIELIIDNLKTIFRGRGKEKLT